VDFAIRFSVSLLPVVLFLLTLFSLDSYKLVPVRNLVLATVIGAGIAALCLPINDVLIQALGIRRIQFSRYGAPPIEEAAKTGLVLWLIARGRIGFLVDAAIVGFAIGTGFALIENTYYVKTRHRQHPAWMVRGLGTAVMRRRIAIGAVVGRLRPGWRGFWFRRLLLATVHSDVQPLRALAGGGNDLLHGDAALIALVTGRASAPPGAGSVPRWMTRSRDQSVRQV
jgi:RsiW-degrading membrane proteinase PrsW (M82 family)